MRYWSEMRSKYGFNDGEAVPDGAEVYRTVYIRAVNKLAEQHNSNVRAAAYDRFGLHNWCLILFYDVNDLAGYTSDELTEPLDVAAKEVLEPDAAMDEAIHDAYRLDLDSFVQVFVDLSEDFDEFVDGLLLVNAGDPLVTEVNGQAQHVYSAGRVRLVREIQAFDGTLLPVGSEYTVIWIDYYPRLVGLAKHPNDRICAMSRSDALIVVEIPMEVCAESENSNPIPPFHLRDLDDETLDEYGEFYDWNAAQIMMQRAVRELGQSVQLINGYGNTVTSSDPEAESE